MASITKREKSSKGFSGFLKNNLLIIISFLVPALIMFTAFAIRKFYPFGNQMIPVIDSWHQYYPFLAEYQRMLKEGSSMLYSFNVGGGVNFLGTIANYLACPLYLLTYFIPSGTPWLQAFLALTVVLRIGFAGMSFALFLRKVFKRNDLSLVTFSVMYALCAYVIGYYWNIMWLDTFALMPLVIAGVIGVLRDRKFSLYIISLALSVIFSFYIGYMVCIFVLLVSICYTVVSFVSMKESLKNAGKMVLYTAVAFMLTAFVTVPAYLALSSSDSAGALSEFPLEYTVNYGYGYKDGNVIVNTLMAIVRTVTNLLAYTRPIKLDTGLPNIACGVLSLVLIPFYITTKKIKLKEKIVSLSLCAFMILSFVVNQLNYIWHGMSTPAMVYYRFSFIFSFIVIVLAYRAFTLIDFFSKKTFIAASALMAVYLAAAFFLQRKLSVAITAVGAAVIIFGFFLYRKGKLKMAVLSVLLCLFTLCEMSLSALYGVSFVSSASLDDYPQDYSEVSELLAIAEEDYDSELYRTEFCSPYTLNDGALYGEFGISTFNSMCDKSYPDFFAEFGLAASKANNVYTYLEASPVTDLFLNIKYLIARDGEKAADNEYRQVVATTDECTLYENSAYVPMGYMASTDLLSFELHDKKFLPVNGQNAMFSLATGEGEVLKVLTPSKPLYGEYGELIEELEDFDYYYSIDLTKKPVESDGEKVAPVYAEYTVEEDGNYYCMFYSSAKDEVNIYINGDEDNPFTLISSYANVSVVGSLKKGDTVKVELPLKNGINNHITTYLLKLDDEAFSRGRDKLSESTMTLTEWTNREVKGNIDVKEAGLFTTSVLYDEGWTAYVDGKEVKITPVAETFIAFELDSGEHSIELRYTTPGLYLGITVTAVGIVLFVCLCVAESVLKKKCKTGTLANTEVKAKESKYSGEDLDLHEDNNLT
ncbi:MAG: YfhO family protein [Ruminococcus sp.]